jgi:SAM-dependent methyltransferase
MPIQPDAVFPLRPVLPVPPGVTEAELYRFLKSVRPADAPALEMANYCEQDWKRFVYTLGLVEPVTGTCLELGSNPYFTSTLLQSFTQLKVTMANYFSTTHGPKGAQQIVYQNFRTGKTESRNLEYYHFSIEAEPFPFPSQSFDVVLFCEILEHLQLDPAAALREIRRVLKDGGTLVLTTPNVNRLENVTRMISGSNIYDPYSGYGPYGRHNREYNKHELNLLLQYCGFEVDALFTADVHANRAQDYSQLEPLIPLLKFRQPDLGQYIFARCRATRPPREKRPDWLYRSYRADQLE